VTHSHTPGPWRAKTLMVVNAKGETVVHVGVSNNFCPPRPDECVANACLIAAAPDLLALAKQYASECSGCDGTGVTRVTHSVQGGEVIETPIYCEDCADIRAVIAKAEGRS
jgi:hypothetical protein